MWLFFLVLGVGKLRLKGRDVMLVFRRIAPLPESTPRGAPLRKKSQSEGAGYWLCNHAILLADDDRAT